MTNLYLHNIYHKLILFTGGPSQTQITGELHETEIDYPIPEGQSPLSMGHAPWWRVND